MLHTCTCTCTLQVLIMALLLLQLQLQLRQVKSFAFHQRPSCFSSPIDIIRNTGSRDRSTRTCTSIASVTTATQGPLINFVHRPCHHGSNRYRYGYRYRCSNIHSHHHYHHHHCTTTTTNKAKKDYPILPLSIIQQSIGENRTIASEPFTWNDLRSIILEQKDVSLLSRSLQIQSNYIHYTNKVKEEWVNINDCIVYTKFGDCRKRKLQPHDDYDHGDDTDDDDGDDTSTLIFQKVKDETTDKYKIIPSIQETKKENIILTKLLPNDYPYYVTSDIQHYCLWKLNGSVTDDDIENAILELKLNAEAEAEAEAGRDRVEIETGNGNDKVDGDHDNHSDDDSDDGGIHEDFKKLAPTAATMQPKLGKVIDTISWINPKHLQSIPDIDHAQILCLRETIVPQ